MRILHMTTRKPLKTRKLIILSIIVGFISGLGAFIFYTLLEVSTKFFIEGLGGYKPYPAGGDVEVTGFVFNSFKIPLFLIPAIGGILSGFIVYSFAPEAEGHGTDAVIKSFHKMKGIIRWRVPVVKTIASAITIGSGGSAGREGPIAQIGAGFGSFLASLFNLSDRDKRILVICGVSGGIGSIFQSPMGGALFGIEVLYKKDYEVEAIVPSFTSSIVAYTLYNLILGFTTGVPFGSLRIFSTPPVKITSPADLVVCLIIAVFCGLVGLVYIKAFYTTHNLFKKLKVRNHFKPAIGGVLTGLIAIYIPEAMGMGYGLVQLAIDGKIINVYGASALIFLIAFIFAKIMATSFTIGSGGSGGVFAPSVVIGGMVGALFGYAFQTIGIVEEPAYFVLVGMASFVSAVAKTPIASIIMVLEMTGGYNLLPVLMISSILAYKITGDHSIYSEQVPTRIDSPAHRAEMVIDVLENIKVRDAMVPAEKVITLTKERTLKEVLELIEKTGHMGYPVLEDGKVIGIITFEDVEKVPVADRDKTTVGEIMTRDVLPAYPDESLEDALKKLASREIGRLPVLSRDNSTLLGIITRSDIMRAHAKEVLKLGK